MTDLVTMTLPTDQQAFQKTVDMLTAIKTNVLELEARTSGVMTPLPVTSPHPLEASDSGKALYFNDASDATFTIPDTLIAGFNVMVSNIGAGGVVGTAGTQTVNGTLTLGSASGVMSILLLTDVNIQSTER